MKTLALSLALLFATAGTSSATVADDSDGIHGEVIPVECYPEWKVTSAGPNLILTCAATHITIICPKSEAHGKTRQQLRKARGK